MQRPRATSGLVGRSSFGTGSCASRNLHTRAGEVLLKVPKAGAGDLRDGDHRALPAAREFVRGFPDRDLLGLVSCAGSRTYYAFPEEDAQDAWNLLQVDCPSRGSRAQRRSRLTASCAATARLGLDRPEHGGMLDWIGIGKA